MKKKKITTKEPKIKKGWLDTIFSNNKPKEEKKQKKKKEPKKLDIIIICAKKSCKHNEDNKCNFKNGLKFCDDYKEARK